MTRRPDHAQLSEDADSQSTQDTQSPQAAPQRPDDSAETSAPTPSAEPDARSGTHGRPSDDADPGHS